MGTKTVGRPFVKGDPRINRKGRPKTADAFRKFAQSIAHEPAINPRTGEPVMVDGKIVTVTEAILRQWASSPDPRLQSLFVQYAYGKVPDTVEVNGKDGRPIETRIVIEYADVAPDAPETT